jgi:hypothetical protein
MITTSQPTPKRRRPSFPLDVLEQIYQATMERRSVLGFGALAAEQGSAVTSDEMFRRVYLAGDEEAAERASRLGNELLCREVGISKFELERYLLGEGADPPSSNLIEAFFGRRRPPVSGDRALP